MLGMSVVGSDYEELKRFNLAELYDPSLKQGAGEGTQAGFEDDAAAKQDPTQTATRQHATSSLS